MMEDVIERPSDRDPTTDGPGGDRPTVHCTGWLRGFRISRVLRPDGSSFTVTVPALGVAEGTEHLAPHHRWITEDGGRRPPSHAALLRLAAALRGGGVPDHLAR
jgi:hypothetical protein